MSPAELFCRHGASRAAIQNNLVTNGREESQTAEIDSSAHHAYQHNGGPPAHVIN
jgi:hypothetical protein